MPKSKPKKKDSKLTSFVDEFIELPEALKHLVNPGTEHEGKIRLVFNQRTVQLAQTFTGELIFARQLERDIASIQLTSNAIALYINQTEPDLEANEVVRKARSYYEKHHNYAEEDGMTLALTDANNIVLTPVEYGDDELEGSALRKPSVDGEDVPEWRREKSLHLPPPKKSLTNMYEYRLKQVRDLLIQAEEEDAWFAVNFYQAVNGAVSKALRLIGGGEETDSDGFPSIVPDS